MDHRTRILFNNGIYIGTSSWKYEGWAGLIYRRQYKNDGHFKSTCLEEYAEHFMTVGIDHTYYAWPTHDVFQRYYKQTPSGFRFGVKVTDAITVFRYPKLKRFGSHAGQLNPDFLSVHNFTEHFFRPLEPFLDKIGPVILEFSEFHIGTLDSGRQFLELLDHFLAHVGRLGLKLCIELRNRSWLQPEYFELAARHRVSHVINSWTKMPTIAQQLELMAPYDLPLIVTRALLQPDTWYKNAVRTFYPYKAIAAPNLSIRRSIADLIEFAHHRSKAAYVFVNNRLEGSAPLTIDAVLDLTFAKRE